MEFCPQFNSEWGCQWYDECWYRHIEFTDAADAAVSTAVRTADVSAVSAVSAVETVDGTESPEMNRAYKQSPDRKSNATHTDTTVTTQTSNGDADGDVDGDINGDSSSFSKMDGALAAYYADCDRKDYFDEDGKGKFLQFVDINDFDEEQVEGELGDDVEPNDCSLLDMDDDFPLMDSEQNQDTKQRNAAILKVLQHCYKHGQSPLSVVTTEEDQEEDEKEVQKEDQKEEEEKDWTHLDRMISTLRHYSKLDLSANEEDKQQFLDLIHFDGLLGDFVHIMAMHSTEDIELVQRIKSEQFQLFSKCSSTNCLFLFNQDSKKKELQKQSDESMEGLPFYRELMDAMHCYLVHSFDVGLRIKVTETASESADKKENQGLTEWEDAEYKHSYTTRCGKHTVFVFKTSWCIDRVSH